MVDSLLNTAGAWAQYLYAITASGVAPVAYEEIAAECLSGNGSAINYSYFAGVSNIEVDAELIGIDVDSCISYWHLTGGNARFIRDTSTFNCHGGLICSTPPIPFSNPERDYGEPATFDAAVTDGGSALAPGTGEELLPHAGYPVVAAVRVAADQWQAFAAGDASGLTIALAAAACGTGGMNVCGTGGECDTAVLINFT